MESASIASNTISSFSKRRRRNAAVGADVGFQQFNARRTGRVLNWSKTVDLGPSSAIAAPKCRTELAALLAQGPVKPLGSRLSFESIHARNPGRGLLLDMSAFSGGLSVEDGCVRAASATPLADIYTYLVDRNLELDASPGVIGVQTLAGALATGTHGQGLRQSSLSDAVAELEVMLPEGQIAHLSDNDPRFPAFIQSMGCLGLLLSAKLRTKPLKPRKLTKMDVDETWLFENHQQLNETSEMAKTWWFPWSGKCHVWLIDQADDALADAYRNGGNEPLDLNVGCQTNLSDALEISLAKLGAQTRDTQLRGDCARTLTRFHDGSHRVGNIYQLTCKGIPAPQINCEIAIPLEKMPEAFNLLKSWHSKHGNMHYPFILRCCGPSQAWLSPANRGAVCWIGFLVYLADDGQFARGSLEWMARIQESLAQLGGIPHLGKHFEPELFDWNARLPRLGAFMSLRAELDPREKLLNPFLKRWLGAARTASIA